MIFISYSKYHTAVIVRPLHHQWSVLVCNATKNNDLKFSSLRFFDLCMPPLKVHVVARQSVHSTGTLLVRITQHARLQM